MFVAVKVSGYVSYEFGPGVPDRTAVPSVLAVNVMPAGRVPERVIVAVGGPTLVIVNVNACPVCAVALVADVKTGGRPTISVNACVVLPTVFVAVNVIG